MHKWKIIIGILASVTLLSVIALIVVFLRRNKSQQNSVEDPKVVSKTMSANRTISMQNQYLYKENMEGQISDTLYIDINIQKR